MGRAVRRPQAAKSCHIDQLGIWPTCSRRAASHCCPFWQPSCAFRWSAPDGPKRPLGRPLRTRPRAVDYLLSPECDFVGDAQRASRYALRVSRSVVVGLSLSRRNAASESEINAGRRPQAAVRENHATLTRLVYGRLVAVGTSQSASLTALLSREPYSNISTGWWQWRICRGLCEL